MNKRNLIARIVFSIFFAGMLTLGFAFFFFPFLMTVMMVGGDGQAPGITYLAGAVLEFTSKLLGISAFYFWPLVVFIFSFLLIFSKTKTPSENNAKLPTFVRTGIISVLFSASYCL